MKWQSVRDPYTGKVLQSGVPTGPDEIGARGLNLRGVVTAVYVFDDDGFPQAEVPPNTVLVDVLTYGEHNTLIQRVPWSYGRSGMHEGDVMLPRAATLDAEDVLDLATSNPAALDGDHVIVSFIEGKLNQPYVSGCIGHPSSDKGNSNGPATQRLRLKVADGNPRFWRHRGATFGIDPAGNFVLDTRRAHPGAYQTNGTEPAPTNDGQNGNVILDLQEGSTVTLRIGDGATVTIADRNGDTTMTVGDGAVSVAVAEPLEALFNDLRQWLVEHQHTYAFGPTGQPITAPTAPTWDSAIVSDKVTLPETD